MEKLYSHPSAEYSEREREERNEGEISKKTLKSFFDSFGCLLAFNYLLTLIMMQSMKTISDFWLKSIFSVKNSSFIFLDNLSYELLYVYGLIILLLAAFIIINNVTRLFLFLKSSKMLFKKLMKTIIFSKMKFFDNNEIGDIINRVSNDTFIIDNFIPVSLPFTCANIISALAHSLVVWIQIPWMIPCKKIIYKVLIE